MSYINKRTGKRTYTLKEKIKYHNAIANTGRKKGKAIPLTTRVRHANSATKCVNKLNRFMKNRSYKKSYRRTYRQRRYGI